MLRDACGFKLANDGHDTRALQHYLGHKNIQHTVRCTYTLARQMRAEFRRLQAIDAAQRTERDPALPLH
jgi:type 1 fimbriae regulatory protein FimB/type 1 fimbriae regulatory protein FimE